MLNIESLSVEVEDRLVVNDFSLKIKSGETHILMGPNGSGKSTLINAIMGRPGLKVKSGSVKLNDTEILKLPVNKRANLGIFSSFQNPVEIQGLSMRSFLRTALNSKILEEDKSAKTYSPLEFIEHLYDLSKKYEFDTDLLLREVNFEMSGGEKKRSEIMQMAVLRPKFALLDEIDSGLDIDALKKIANTINKIQKDNNTGLLIITHFPRILKYIEASHVHLYKNGKIEKSGDTNLALKIEKEGYAK
ncbi:MAG: Fe-S cluster assembly ATPase SufC [Candidatus Gracilibacteria bacterium]|nr:Fe-S cluster assembly ATPase SufC [Candidatus Gracilibacteria bacterium]